MPVSKGDKEIKITDKRMFTADGELREEYRFLAEKSTAAAPAAADPSTPAPPPGGPPLSGPAAASTQGTSAARGAPAQAAQASPAAPATPADDARAARPGGRGSASGGSSRTAAGGRGEPPPPGEPDPADAYDGAGARLEIPGSPPGLGPSFYDLAAMLAEPVAVYLGDVELPDGQSAENLEMARLYIDLLDVLRQKTLGNLTAQESAFLEDLLYRMRVRYVQKRG